MAWIVKNSGTMTVDRRAEPYLNAEMKARLEAEILPRYPNKRAAVLPVLHAIENKYNWIPLQAIEEAAAFLDLNPSEVLDTASFYEMFHLQPKGRHLIMVCQSISCELMGQEKLMHDLEHKLGVEAGQTTDDGKFTLTHGECLGACGGGPCALVDEQLYENLTSESIEKILDALA